MEPHGHAKTSLSSFSASFSVSSPPPSTPARIVLCIDLLFFFVRVAQLLPRGQEPGAKIAPWSREWWVWLLPAPLPPPFPYNQGVAYLCSFPITRTPISREKDITPYLGHWLPLAITTNKKQFSWFSREFFPRRRPKNTPPPFPEKMGMRMRPPHAFEGGGGGGIASGPQWKNMQNHSVNDSEMGNPSIFISSCYILWYNINVYFALYVLMIE